MQKGITDNKFQFQAGGTSNASVSPKKLQRHVDVEKSNIHMQHAHTNTITHTHAHAHTCTDTCTHYAQIGRAHV